MIFPLKRIGTVFFLYIFSIFMAASLSLRNTIKIKELSLRLNSLMLNSRDDKIRTCDHTPPRLRER